MRERVEQVNNEEHDSQVMLHDPKTAKEPVGNQGVCKEASTESVERKQGSQFDDDWFTFWTDSSLCNAAARACNFNSWGQEPIDRGGRDRYPGKAQKNEFVGLQERHSEAVLQEQWHACDQRSQRAAAINEHVVNGQAPSPLGILNQRGNYGLIESVCG